MEHTTHESISPRPPFKALIAAGGTGGHLFPAIAVAEECASVLGGNCAIEFIGTAERIEATIVPKHGYPFHTLPIAGLQKLLSFNTLKLPFQILQSIQKARSVLQAIKPHCVICAGAYLSYPVGIAASQLGIPLFLMESNALPGKTILQLASRATRIYATFEESRQHFSGSIQAKIEVKGNPVRSNLSALPDQRAARIALNLATDKPTVFVFGGSLGARSINAAVNDAMDKFRAAGIQVLWQTGKNYSPMTNTGGVAEVLTFIDNMANAYAAADLVVCRAGATTLAELAIVRKPAILVPFPQAANDHQTANARALHEQGAAILLRDADVHARLFESAHGILQNARAQAAMTDALARFAKPHAARDIAEAILQHVYS
ncbi:MAG: undecaprenyldiphospho-muramoylpentapeptide beta-N-acetylglucosaminyltransferase [Candidatus Kapaibacterium sp.]|nr:MAG: undecaprenyldiphospho-muramoylpentapeptide beta-N-acetylglucosaminyltransferase [Candidatus Kapabacteria bacterium]